MDQIQNNQAPINKAKKEKKKTFVYSYLKVVYILLIISAILEIVFLIFSSFSSGFGFRSVSGSSQVAGTILWMLVPIFKAYIMMVLLRSLDHLADKQTLKKFEIYLLAAVFVMILPEAMQLSAQYEFVSPGFLVSLVWIGILFVLPNLVVLSRYWKNSK